VLGRVRKIGMLLGASASLYGCAVHNPSMWDVAKYPKQSAVQKELSTLPAAGQRVAIAVYGFTDQTGQFKPSDNVQTLSRAVTQGATSILVKALQDAGSGRWFQVIERERLDNVLRERAVIREMRSSYLGETKVNPAALPPLLFAGILLEGGIIGYDSNTKTGGSGARFLGIGGNVQYREDTITIYLRAVSVKTGEVLSNVSVRKSVSSVAVGGNAFRYVSFKDLLELETGVTYNEPDQLAMQQAIEKGVYALIMEGAMQNLWCLDTQADEGRRILSTYVAERDSVRLTDVSLPVLEGRPISGTCNRTSPASTQPILIPPLEPVAKPVVAESLVPRTPPVEPAKEIAVAPALSPPAIRMPVPVLSAVAVPPSQPQSPRAPTAAEAPTVTTKPEGSLK
jgi:curli production assembly/transport component CsgG